MKVKSNTISLLMDMGRIIRSRMERALPLSYSQSETLRFLHWNKSATMHDIAAHFHITAPSATSLVSELVRTGLVARVDNPKDRRVVELRLTAKGNTAQRQIQKKREVIIADILSVLSGQDQKQFNSILSKIVSAVEPN